MMAVPQWPAVVVVLLLGCAGLHCSSSPSVCPESCTCHKAPLLNCSSSGLSSVPQYIQDSVTELDFSHNRLYSVTLHRPYRNLRNVWLGNNTITHLSLCIDTNLGNQSDRDRHPNHLRLWHRRRCVSWAPTLQLLSVERNQLVQLPEGLEGSPSLWILQLSYNRISALEPRALSRLQQLKELHLQHNLITSVHPQMFENLSQLKVLDLSFNMLTSLHPLMYLSLRNIEADVRLGGNRWQCDCSMRNLRRRMAFDNSRGLQAWSMVCASPSIHSGKDLLQLEEDDLNCFGTENMPELHQDVTVHSGSEILLSCSAQDSLWWRPSGQASVRETQAGLFINDVTEKDTGLYVCISEEHNVVSVFNLQISRIGHAGRIATSLPRIRRQIIPQGMPDRTGQERNQRATPCNLTLAVCLSVFITFLVAFIIGVLTRPYIDVLCTKVTKKKSPPATNSASDAQQSHYDNAAFYDGEEPDEVVTHRERRVTFSTITVNEDNNVEYYDTVASSNQESVNNDENKFTTGHSGSENSSNEEDDQRHDGELSGDTKTRRRNKRKLKQIPKAIEVEERRRLSSSSDSSCSERSTTEDQISQRDYTTPKSPLVAEDSVQQNSEYLTSRQVEVAEISREDRSDNPGFPAKPFTDWSPLKNDTNPTDSDQWPENGDPFEFSTSDRQNSDISSSSSYVSEDEPTQYTVNSVQEEEEDIDVEAKSPDYDLFCGSERIYETINHNDRSREINIKTLPLQESQISSPDGSGSWPAVDLQQIPHIKRRLDIRASSPAPDSPSRSENEYERVDYTERPRVVGTENHDLHTSRPTLKLKQIPHIKRRLDIKRRQDIEAPSVQSDSSFSSDSEDEPTYHKVIPREVNTTRLPLQNPQTSSHDLHGSWPALKLENIPPIKRRLDIKRRQDTEAPSVQSDSSFSSDSEDETTYHRVGPSEVNTTHLPLQKSQTSSHDLNGSWPALDLENIPHIKRRLDIKASSPDSDSSSSSESEDEMTHNNERPWKEAQIQNHEKDDLGISKLTSQKSETISHDPETLRSVNLGNITRIKRRLAINPPSLPLESLSDESTNITVEGKPTQPNKSTNSYSSRSSYSSFSNDTSDSRTTDPLDRNDLGITNHQTGTLLPDLNKSVSLVTDLPSSPNSSEPVSNIFPNPKPFQGIKLEKYTTVTDDSGSTPINDNDSTTPKINPELQSRWATMNLGVSRFRKRLEITSQSRSSPNLSTPPSPGTPSSPGSESGSGNKSSRTRLNRRSDRMQGIIPNDSLLVLDRDKDNSSNLAEVNEGLRKTSSFHVTEEKSNPDTLLTGYTTSHIRTYLVSEKAPATAPLQGLSDSSSSSENEGVSTEYAGNRRNRTSQSKYHTHAVNDRRDESHSGVEIKSQTASLREESDSMLPNLSLTNIPRVKRALNIRAPSPRQSSYKSVSEDKTTDFSTSHLNLGVPRIKRRLDIKAPSPQANNSSSASESENEVKRYTAKESKYSSNMSGIIDDYSQITYKRSIMKGSLPLRNSFSASGRSQTIDDAKIKTQDLPDRVSDRPASFSPWRVPSVSPDDVYRKQTETSRGTTDMDLPSEISQTVISRHFSTSITSRHRDVDLPSPQEAPPAVPECSPPDSPDFSRGKNDRGRTDMTLLNTYSYPISTRFGKVDNTAASSTMAVSENKREKRGLTALKVMSTERLKWDIQEEDLETI